MSSKNEIIPFILDSYRILFNLEKSLWMVCARDLQTNRKRLKNVPPRDDPIDNASTYICLAID